eukprot:jgi/Ulvmu1/9962/UM059_0010.1
MAKLSSKRKRKERDKFSLKHKGSVAQSNVEPSVLLSDELRNESIDQQIVCRRKKHAPDRSSSKVGQPATQQPSKLEQRKIKQISRQKASQAKVKDAIDILNSAKLDDSTLSILLKTSTRGGTVTASQRLKRETVLHKAGVQVPADSVLLRKTSKPGLHHRNAQAIESSLSSEISYSSSSDSKDVPSHPRDAGDTAAAAKHHSHKRDLSKRAPPTVVNFGQKAGCCQAHATSGENSPESRLAESPASATRSVEADHVQGAEELRRKMIASGEIVVTEADHPETGQPRSVPSLGPTRHRKIERPAHIEEARLQLPVLGMEHEIMAMTDEHDMFLLCGATGCGKTTQVPQFLLEAGFGCAEHPERCGLIGVTQPRRVAAVSTARRVAEELGQTGFSVSSGGDGLVGYQVRHEKSIGAHAALKFMTDGILMREVQEDFLLAKYSVIIIDEAHERSLNTDLLIGMLSRIVPQRRAMNSAGKVYAASGLPVAYSARLVQPLKVIIMSATLRVDDFLKNERLFPQHLYPNGPPPLIDVPARQFPVTVHFSKRTEMSDYIGAAYRKVTRIHQELPAGGILVFVTGQREVQHLCKRLQATFPCDLLGNPTSVQASASPGTVAMAADEDSTIFDINGADRAEMESEMLQGPLWQGTEDAFTAVEVQDDFVTSDPDEDETLQLGDNGMSPQDIAAAEEYFDRQYGCRAANSRMGSNGDSMTEQGSDEEAQHDAIGVRAPVRSAPRRHAHAYVLPLYAMLLPQEQGKVFEDPPAGHRLIVVATNVAETSLTIPGIRYVVDAGRAKAKMYEELSGVNRYEVRWISQASADQRAGRAGRTGPGHCYRLFSSAVFNDTFPKFSPPEITNTPLEGIVLSMHAMGLPKIVNFPFPASPRTNALQSAEQCLLSILALRVKSIRVAAKSATSSDLELTDMGAAMAAFPLSPRHSRMILAAVELASGQAHKAAETVHHALGLAAALSCESPYLEADTILAAEQPNAGQRFVAQEEGVNIRNRVHSAHQRLRDPSSDALSSLNALLAFEAQPTSQAGSFCNRNFLHAAHLREMSALRKQLVRIVCMQSHTHHLWAMLKATMQNLSNIPGAAGDHMSPMSKETRKVLIRSVAAGWADQVAKRVRSRAQLDAFAAQGKGSRAIRYQSCSHGSDLFIHPRSFLHKCAPDYVVYLGQTSTEKRTYMHTLTCADPAWLVTTGLAMCDISDPAPEVSPAYDPATDRVLSWCHATYGVHAWPLPMHAVVHPDLMERCAHFANALLSGRVMSDFGQLAPMLNVKPTQVATMTGRALRRISDLISVLSGNCIDCRQKLLSQWNRDENFLKPQIRGLLRKGHSQVLDTLWPRLTQHDSPAHG